MNNLTIQINSLEALERLIGGDSQVEIEVRNSVVQKFAEKHLKPLANSDQIKTTLTQIQLDISRQIREKCEKEIATFKTSCYGSVTDIKLNESIKGEIVRRVGETTDSIIRQHVDDAIKTWNNDVELKRRIDARFEYYTKEAINAEIKARLEKVKATL